MKMKLGEKIKVLRRLNGKTQEEVANALSVTNQAVSRWESGNGYPDMELIPSIANYFHVTIDSLFGYDNDRQKRIDEIHKISAEMMVDANRLEECAAFLREAAKEYPTEVDILSNLGHTLIILGAKEGIKTKECESDVGKVVFDYEQNRKNKYIMEGIQIYESVLALDCNASIRKDVIYVLSMYYEIIGDFDKANALAEKQAPIFISKEILKTHAADGETLSNYRGEAIIELLWNLNTVLLPAISHKRDYRDSDAALKVCLALGELYRAIFEDGNFGKALIDMMSLYFSASLIAARSGDEARAKELFDTYYDFYQKYEENAARAIEYTSPLLMGVCGYVPKIPLQIVPSEIKKRIPKNLFVLLRDDPKYEAMFQNDQVR